MVALDNGYGDAHEINDPTPIRLRRVDRADDPQELLTALAEQQSVVLNEAINLRTILTRDMLHDPERAVRRATARVIELCEAAGRAEDCREQLSRALRSAGRL